MYNRSTACARDVSCEKTFSQEIAKYPSNVPFVLKSSKNNQYCITSTIVCSKHGVIPKLILDSSYLGSMPHSLVFISRYS